MMTAERQKLSNLQEKVRKKREAALAEPTLLPGVCP
jgi:hypothetical protein